MANTPNIRFKGFTDDWEQRKLGEILEEVVNKTSDFIQNPLYSLTIENGITPKTERYEREFLVKKGEELFKIVKPSEFVTNPMNLRFGAVGYNTNTFNVSVSGYYDVFKIDNNECSSFWNSYFKVPTTLKKFDIAATGSLIEKRRVKFSTLKILDFLMPTTLQEKKRIAIYFECLDNLITLLQRKCDEVRQLKKFMLQEMFPKSGELIPEIRFAGFTDNWEQRKLDEWGSFYYGKSCPKWSVTEDATIPCIRYGELYTKFGAKIDRVYSYTNMSPDNLRFSKGTEVLIPRVGEDPMDYNHCTWLSMPNVAIGEMISVYNTENNPLFTAIMFNATLRNEFAMRVEGGSVTNLYFEKLKNIHVSFPTLEEQEKISSYFNNLDHLITLHQRKCDELKEVKRFMLQNMFPQKG